MEFLEQILYGNTLKNWGVSLLIIVGALIFNKIIQFLNKRVFQKLSAKTRNRFDDILFQSLEAPVLLGVMLVAIWVAFSRLETPEKINEMVSNAYKILTTLNVTWFFVRLSTSFLEQAIEGSKEDGKKTRVDNKLLPLLRRTLNVIIWGIGIVTALSNAGVSVSALLGALGVGGMALALASQDTIKNLLAGITVLTDRPFQIGDRVRFDSIDGTVEDIGLRSTRIRTLEERVITIPNSTIMDAAIENVNSEPMRKVVLKLGLTYDTTPEKMNEAMNLLKAMPSKIKYVSAKDLVVAFTEFADSALGITFIYYIEKRGNIFDTNTKVNMEILTSFNAAGLNFAFPTQTIYVEK